MPSLTPRVILPMPPMPTRRGMHVHQETANRDWPPSGRGFVAACRRPPHAGGQPLSKRKWPVGKSCRAREVETVQPHSVIFERAKLTNETVASIRVEAGRITEISVDAPVADAEQRIDLENMLVIPGLIDGHIHLDKSFIGDAWKPHRPSAAGFDIRERVAIEKELLAGAQSVERRAAALIELAVSHGTMYMRSHVDRRRSRA
jgi:hypothetical protein